MRLLVATPDGSRRPAVPLSFTRNRLCSRGAGSRRPAVPLCSKRKHVCSCLLVTAPAGSRRPAVPLSLTRIRLCLRRAGSRRPAVPLAPNRRRCSCLPSAPRSAHEGRRYRWIPNENMCVHVCRCPTAAHDGRRCPWAPRKKHGHQPPVCREHMGLRPTCSRRPTLAWGVVSRQCPSPGAQDVVPPDQRGGLGRRPKVPTASDWPVGCRGNKGLGPTCSRRPTGLGPSCSRRPTAYKLLH